MKIIDLVLAESLRLARAGSRFPVGARRFATSSPGNTSGQRHVCRRARSQFLRSLDLQRSAPLRSIAIRRNHGAGNKSDARPSAVVT